ncbi:uncharacterized protein Triagg1_2918 [Trichoderma aggressivum f. europaeum]|uniref:Uncharacterized protein n=1 Tax=Trichoderma aggressivum f. europaeum TaxID=173218 RepID=A0AAE1M0V4_9HYPO|nr:hypothetical protein Triagg1_2918 [Trichoderma aggressivum f. europaeum]
MKLGFLASVLIVGLATALPISGRQPSPIAENLPQDGDTLLNSPPDGAFSTVIEEAVNALDQAVRGFIDSVKMVVGSLTKSLSDIGKVDPERIGVLGICASGGYTSYVAQSDTRIKALGTVSAACVGRMTRNGGLYESNNKESPEAIAGALKAAGDWRTAHANDTQTQAPRMFETEASAVPEDSPSFFKSAVAYDGTKCGHHARSDQRVPPSIYDLMIGYDSFIYQHLISPRPLLMIAGTEAETLHHSKTAVEGARDPKELFIVKGKNHFDLYDNFIESAPKLVEFYANALAQ